MGEIKFSPEDTISLGHLHGETGFFAVVVIKSMQKLNSKLDHSEYKIECY